VKILLTGATGFIGSKLWGVLLDRGHDVIGVSRHPSAHDCREHGARHVRYAMGDVLPDSLIDFSPEILVHLAWSGIPDFSAKACTDNVEKQMRFLDKTEKLKSLKKILVSGSCVEYGDKKGLCQEAENVLPVSYFSWAKQTLSNYFRLNCQQRNIQLLWFRVFYVYGPGQRPGALIPTLIDAFRAGLAPEIKSPAAANDFIYIDDVLDAFVKGIELKDGSGVLNLGSGHPVSVLEVARTVENVSNGDASGSIEHSLNYGGSQPSPAMIADISQAKSVLGWTPKTRLCDGIERTWRLSA